ncbi:MAG: 50S ribosomal protein L29 [Candidatus Nanoarchaeia archaeon]|nr:50S ribosomal protein L29 [Candidatus Haiyanarchaeum thermophilum]MCW1303105.1 50S ribosomal protein L29 [Candidatus Haiyanarchaeum thermophilum]MCW1303770.1 50S ribosomal protein L29 [Candidatus Haiyanarchaeum thermophilum]MCW1306615.1 50S ribosomal protein L29 [Candidatus Haiyanarchaeum thermophilum]MCW1307027.1 50S ribosomal protein L29 [Candidatus Haiyanarchaeum thermophilum]
MAILSLKKLREMKNEELQKKLDELRLELLNIRGKIRAHMTPDNPGKVREIRKTIARILTVLRERGIKK